MASVEAVDDRTVTITFDGPMSFPYTPFVSYGSPILQASQFADCLGGAGADCTDANFGPIGTGPYVVADFRTNDTVLYRFNPLYRSVESGLPYFGEAIRRGGGTAADAARSVLQLNEADYAWNLQVEPREGGLQDAEGDCGTCLRTAQGVSALSPVQYPWSGECASRMAVDLPDTQSIETVSIRKGRSRYRRTIRPSRPYRVISPFRPHTGSLFAVWIACRLMRGLFSQYAAVHPSMALLPTGS